MILCSWNRRSQVYKISISYIYKIYKHLLKIMGLTIYTFFAVSIVSGPLQDFRSF